MATSRSKSAGKPAAMIPYRDEDNRAVKYVPGVAPPSTNIAEDSDGEPLITPQGELDDDSLQRFSATGRPLQPAKFNALQSLAGDMYSLPQLLPKRYTDDSIIPAIVVNIISSPTAKPPKNKGRRASFLTRLKTGMSEEKNSNGRLTKVVYMPRREYLKWFARDEKGQYIGSEPKKEWTEDELEEAFKEWQPAVRKKSK